MAKRRKKKVIVGMSGGVDSSVAALLLKKQGYDVTGVFMKNWSGASLGLNGDAARRWEQQCPWEQDAVDVRRVCQVLDIPYYTMNFEKEYKTAVLDYFFSEYARGRTPNPDVMCNKEIKFKVFLNKCLTFGVDFIATGHYAKRVHTDHGLEIHIPKDRNKDQTYFLYTLTQQQLQYTLFPLYDMKKSEVRALAKAAGLPVYNKPDSQGICFVGEVPIRELLALKIPRKRGDIVTTRGKIVGRHEGLAFYTIGQRQGIGVGGGIPYYVVDKDTRKNQLIVGIGPNDKALFHRELLASSVHCINEDTRAFPLRCSARIRYRQTLEPVTVYAQQQDNTFSIRAIFDSPQRAVTPGQVVVFYQGTRMLGGGIIDS